MLFQNTSDDIVVREILSLRRRSSNIKRPEFSTSVVTPVSIETCEPDLQASAKILDINTITMSVQVGHPELFQPGDGVMVLQQRSHETLLSKAKVLEITDQGQIYLGGIAPYNLTVVRPEDLLVKEADVASIVLSYVDTEIPQYSKRDLEQLREDMRDDVITPPSHSLTRMPGETPHGVSVRHFPLPNSPVPMGQIVLPIGAEDGVNISAHAAGWMLRRVVDEDLAFQRRWKHWADMESVAGLPSGQSIPFCQFGEPDPGTLERLQLCLNFIDEDWWRSPQKSRDAVELFFDWLLWSLGHPSVPEFPEALRHDRAHDFMIQVFSPGRLILYPADYFGALLGLGNYHDLISTKSAARLMKSIFPGRRNDYRDTLLLDPECGSGAVMLAASNYTYQYQAVTSDRLLAKATILNAYFYVPWCIFPFAWMPTPDPTTTLTTALTLMSHNGIDPHYFDQVQLVDGHDQYLPVALVEPRTVNQLAEWFNQQALSSAQPFELPGVMLTERMDAGSDPLGLPSSPLGLPSSPLGLPPSPLEMPPFQLPGLPSPGGDRLLPPSSDL